MLLMIAECQGDALSENLQIFDFHGISVTVWLLSVLQSLEHHFFWTNGYSLQIYISPMGSFILWPANSQNRVTG
jgi:hypothetical protein